MSYFTVQDEQQKLFTQLPKALLYETKYKQLSNDSKLLYSFLLDRNYLSLQNNWIDEVGRIYIKCNEIAMAEILNKSEKTTRKFKNELIAIGLLEPVDINIDKTKYYLHKPQVSVDKLEEYVGVFNNKVKDKVEKEKQRNKEYRIKVARNNMAKLRQQFSNGNNDRSIENTGLQVENQLQPLETLATVEITDCDQSKLPFSNNDFSNTDFISKYVCTGEPAYQSNSLFVNLYEKYLIPSEDLINILPSYEEHMDLELYEKILLDTINKFKVGRVGNIESYLITSLDARVVKGHKTLSDDVAYTRDYVENTYRKNTYNKKPATKQKVPTSFPEVPEVPAKKVVAEEPVTIEEPVVEVTPNNDFMERLIFRKENGLMSVEFSTYNLEELQVLVEEKNRNKELIEQQMENYNSNMFSADERRVFAMKDLGLI